jgi:hypothetical protein
MSNRVAKPRFTKTEQRSKLAAAIEEFGVVVMPCSFCHSRKLSCKMMEGVSRCKECVRRGRSCDGSGVPVSSLNRIISESQRLRREEEEAAALLQRLQRESSEALAKLERLRKQRESLVTRGSIMVKRGLQSLDELDESERAESEAVVEVQSFGHADVVDWNVIFSDLSQMPEKELDEWNVACQTVEAGPSNL